MDNFERKAHEDAAFKAFQKANKEAGHPYRQDRSALEGLEADVENPATMFADYAKADPARFRKIVDDLNSGELTASQIGQQVAIEFLGRNNPAIQQILNQRSTGNKADDEKVRQIISQEFLRADPTRQAFTVDPKALVEQVGMHAGADGCRCGRHVGCG